MSYSYAVERENLFADEGQRMLLAIRDHVGKCLKKSGAVRLDHAIDCVSGSAWTMIACVDRLVELGELREIPLNGIPGQHRIFVAAKERDDDG